jgi:transposase
LFDAEQDMRHEVIVDVERRRRWRDDEKQAILEEVGVNGATVTDVARRHDIEVVP